MPTNANSDLASTKYARRRKELFDLTKALRDLGADTVIGLPRIAVIGGQSAGKSSLVEAVTGINVPRDSGTCTRCPMECSVRGDTPSWSCQISLKRQYDGETPIQPTTICFGHRITDKNEVELQLRRAQGAILSPHRSPEFFLDRSDDDLKELIKIDTQIKQFSKNAVVIDIEDPHGTDLFFVDLPGLIQNADQQYIDIVKNLVVHYIADLRTIILVTIPASGKSILKLPSTPLIPIIGDMENQEAVKLAREADPQGTRTIGVVTKPDTLTLGAVNDRKKWEDVIQGRSHALRLGYYCVRLPDDSERASHSRGEMETIANAFLTTTSPWSGLQGTDRLGVRALVADISKLLMQIVRESLPDLKAELEALLAACERDLSKLPPTIIVDPATEILNRIMAFCRDLQDTVNGHAELKMFVHRNCAVYTSFQKDIWMTAPNFQPFEDTKMYKINYDDEYQEEGSEEGDSEEEEEISIPPVDLYDVKRVIKESIGWELPRNIPYDAKMVLYKRFVDLWPEPATSCFQKIREILNEELDIQITTHFGRFKQLENHIAPLVRSHAGIISEQCASAIAEVIGRERTPYYTQNLHYLDSLFQKWLSRYKHARRNPWDYLIQKQVVCEEVPVAPSTPSYIQVESVYSEVTVFTLLEKLGYRGLKNTDLARLHPPDQFEGELHVMADVRAYFQVAFKRIIDNIPLTIHQSFCQRFTESLQGHLIDKLSLGSPDASQRFNDLLAEDPRLSARREALHVLKKQLLDIQKQLINF